jgi:hypothetical protein
MLSHSHYGRPLTELRECRQLAALVGVLWVGAAGCSRTVDDELAEVAPSAARPAAAPQGVATTRNGAPFGFALRAIDAQAGDRVLLPLRSNIEAARQHGFEQPTFVYGGGVLEQVGEGASNVRWQTQQRALVDNVWLIPIRRGERAAPGDIVLTSWASGSGMLRGIVLGAGNPQSPTVRYLDLPASHPAADAADTLEPSSFHVLRNPGEVGTTLACRSSPGAGLSRVERAIVLHREAADLLVLAFAGKLRRVAGADCKPLPLAPPLKTGERVFVPVVGAFVQARVLAVNTQAGRVEVSYDFGNEQKQQAFGFTNVALELP